VRLERAATSGALVSGFLASACCLGPFVLTLLGLSGAALAHWGEPLRPYLLFVTYLLLAGAWVASYRPRRGTCAAAACAAAPPGRGGRWWLGLATLVVILTTTFPWYADHLPL
jgi:mercuric ion transport protein